MYRIIYVRKGTKKVEFIYSIETPLYGISRTYTTSEKRALYMESSGVCARCGTPNNTLTFDEDVNNIDISFEKSNLEIAHLYGLRNFKNVIHKGNLFHIKGVESINSFDNLLLLCHKCHTCYDDNPTYEKYVKMVELKNELTNHYKREDFIYKSLFFSLDEIEKVCKTITISEAFNYNVTKFLKKLEINEIDNVNIEHYSMYLTKYALSIDSFFKDYDEQGKKLLLCFAKIYSELKKVEDDKNIILKEISKNKIINQLAKTMNELVFNALVSYMIWKCEVLDKYDTSR